MFEYIYNGKVYTNTDVDFMFELGMDQDVVESVLSQKDYEQQTKPAVVRLERNKRLAATDFYMLQDAPAAPMGVTEYRQALRDITEQEGFPDNVVWPELVLSESSVG